MIFDGGKAARRLPPAALLTSGSIIALYDGGMPRDSCESDANGKKTRMNERPMKVVPGLQGSRSERQTELPRPDLPLTKAIKQGANRVY